MSAYATSLRQLYQRSCRYVTAVEDNCESLAGVPSARIGLYRNAMRRADDNLRAAENELKFAAYDAAVVTDHAQAAYIFAHTALRLCRAE